MKPPVNMSNVELDSPEWGCHLQNAVQASTHIHDLWRECDSIFQSPQELGFLLVPGPVFCTFGRPQSGIRNTGDRLPGVTGSSDICGYHSEINSDIFTYFLVESSNRFTALAAMGGT
jgi:hypothetical protein